MDRVLVCGGRNYNETAVFAAAMDVACQYLDRPFCIIHGAARGADTLADNWAKQQGVPILSVAANWDVYGKAAGTMRNIWMLDFGRPTLVIAFPGGNGTAHMITNAKKRNVPVWQPYVQTQ